MDDRVGAGAEPVASLFAAHHLVRSFPGVRALDGVDFAVRSGEVHALVGENGAGKSTLLRIVTGADLPDAGGMTFQGEPFAPRSPADAQRSGVAAIHQELELVPALSVAENLALGRWPRRFGFVRRAAVRANAARALERVGLELDVDARIAELPVAVRQMVAIARALDMDARLVVLDEPTASLDRDEVARLFALLGELANTGTGIVFVGHRLDEILALADRITVLRSGRSVGTWERGKLDRLELVRAMLGRVPELRAKDVRPSADSGRNALALRARELRGHRFGPFDLEVRAGEVLGLAGLLGSGRTELLRLLFGADPASGGELEIGGRPLPRTTPRRSIAAGLAFVPEDRRRDALFRRLSVAENISIAILRGTSRAGVVDRRAVRALAERLVARLGIRASDLAQPAGSLSGGNQQKVILARWLATEPRCLLLDEPTRGIDVGARAEVDALIGELAARGMAVVAAFSSLEELLDNADRAVVLRDGCTRVALSGSELTESACLEAMATAEHGADA